MLMPIHVAAGGLALILGALALSVKKGGPIHRRSGVLFVYAMVAMAVTAAMLGNVGGGLMTIYFVATAWMTVRSDSAWTRRITAGCGLFGAVFAILTIRLGWQAFNTPSGFLNGVPFAMFFFIATVIGLAAAGDLRALRSGVPLRGAPRLRRHLWRMCFALFIAAGSFFSIRERVAKVLPDPFTTVPMRVLPIVLLFGAMFYWLWKLRDRRRPQSSGLGSLAADVRGKVLAGER
jgi:uncharacterized membrane protein